ncbi:MAG TPA: S9 family peptidase [Gemmataceae bacterium]|jgi:dipeptidyl aminopeptidase/acylaminoacyl peptidase|nr:S9 family peptidase [Gemmataceae bacterium]
MPRTLLLFLAIAIPVYAEPVRDHDITIDDYATLATITELAVSPDGKHVAYCEGRWDTADDSRKTDLWVVATDGKGKPTRLTSGRANDRHPKWSADGRSIYVLGNRKSVTDGKTQVWRIDTACGLTTPATKVEAGIIAFDFASQTDTLFYSVDASTTDNDEFTALRNKHKAEYGHGKRTVSEVYRVDLQSWRTEKVIAENRYIREFAVTRDGKRVAMITAPDDTVITSEGRARVDVWEAGKLITPPSDTYRTKAASPWAWLESLAWNADGTRFAFCAIFDAYPTEIIIGEFADGEWTTKRMCRPSEARIHVRGYGSQLRWTNSTSLEYLREQKGQVGINTYLTNLDRQFEGPPSINDQVIQLTEPPLKECERVSLISDYRRFPVLETRLGGDKKILVDPNPQSVTWTLPRVEHITWKAPDDSEVGGVLELPRNYKPGERLPLVVGIHGGPTTSSTAGLSYDALNGRLYFAAHGYAALYPNYRGSTGYGDKFVTDLIGHENDIEVKDILAGIQHLIKEGIADPERVGVMGWSNGGYLTNCLITLKDSPIKFKAASSGAGILDTVAEWGFNDEPAYPMVFKKGLPWETPDIYRKTSPTYGLGNVTTPTLIHVGGSDERCPSGHSRMLYRALKEYKKVPTELVVYPGEPHGLMKLSNRKAKMEWDLAWFDKYLKGAK